MELAGPEGQSTMDARLSALKDRQGDSIPEEQKSELLKKLLPLILAQGLDLVMTEKFLRSPDVPGLGANIEGNPLPGMQSSAGRVGWSALETGLMALMLKKYPNIGEKLRDASIVAHTGLAQGNNQMAEDQIRLLGEHSIVETPLYIPHLPRREPVK